MESFQPSRGRRIIALLALVLNVAFNYAYTWLPLGLEDMRTASEHYPNLFTPAPYAFSIWGLIYLSMLLYIIYTLFPGQRRNPLHDRLCSLLILVNVFASAWILEFTAGFVGFSQLIILVMLFVSAVLFRRAKFGSRSARFVIPFSLLFGWLTVANLANLAAWLSSKGWRGGSLGEIPFTILLIALAALSGLAVSLRYRDFTFPLVIAWAAVAIGVEQRAANPGVGMAAFAAAAVNLVAAAVGGFRSMRPARPA